MRTVGAPVTQQQSEIVLKDFAGLVFALWSRRREWLGICGILFYVAKLHRRFRPRNGSLQPEPFPL